MGGVVDAVFGGGDEPETPDPTATANAQAKADAKTTRLAATLNRYDQTTPWGNLTWKDLGKDKWSSAVTLNPQEQKILDQSRNTTLGLSGATNSAVGRVTNTLGTNIKAPTTAIPDSSGDTRQKIEDALYQRMTSRLDPQYSQRESDLQSQLINQGINMGTEAWDREMGNLSRDRTDAYQTAMDNAIVSGGQEESRQNALQWGDRQNQLAEQYQQRNQLLNELSALRSGTQVQSPQFAGQQTAAQTYQTPVASSIYNSYQGQLANHNAQQNSNNSLMGGLFGLGSAYLMGG